MCEMFMFASILIRNSEVKIVMATHMPYDLEEKCLKFNEIQGFN
jgi:hypothetical protein